ncbi:MAG: right-handed parallel beta-helix repeat-containing protein [Phycisphaerae bacterium]|nr:right-handed parallel beta-helix repeat-containing protein [Phycisphaerae bacterium]
MHKVLIISGVFLSVSVCCFGRVISVAPDGSGEYPSIQAAIDAAADGDEIAAGPGTYVGTVDFAGKAVRLYSTAGAEATVIDGRLIALQDDFNDGTCDDWQIVDEGNTGPSAWSAASGAMVQSSNIYTEPMSDERYRGTYALSPEPISLKAYSISLTMKSDDDDAMGVMFCYQNANNYYRFSWDRQRSYRRLVRMQNGVASTLAGDSVPYVTGQTYNIKIQVTSSYVTVYVDDNYILQRNDSTFRGGPIGLYCWGNQGTHFDDVVVEACSTYFNVVQCANGEGAATVLEGFTVTSSDSGNQNYIFGVYNEGSSPTIVDCIIGDASWASGISNRNSSATISNCVLRNSWAETGGGIINVNSSPIITDCVFIGNKPYAIENSASAGEVRRCSFEGDRLSNKEGSTCLVTGCTFSGGRAFNDHSNPTFINCLFSSSQDGGMYNYYCSPTVLNCTFVRNRNLTHGVGGGMYNRFGGTPTVSNCIFWDNGPSGFYDRDGSVSTVTYSDIEGGWPGEGNIAEQPVFVDADGGDFRLRWYSPGVDAGSNAAAAGINTDFDGNARVIDGNRDGVATVDMGAYEVAPVSESLGTALQVMIAPQEAVDAGAGWRLAGEADWRASGETVSDLTPGYYETEFGELDAWFEPASIRVCVMRDLPAGHTATYRPVGMYAIGQIPPGAVRHGGTLAFYVYSEALGAGAVLSASAQPAPAGPVTFDAGTGLFVYLPDVAADVLPFEVTFTATVGGEVDVQVVEVSPVADLPAEFSLVSRPVQDMPDAESRDYLFVNEMASETDEVLNGVAKKVRSVTIAGKTVALEAGHANGLYDTYSGPYVADIKEMTIYAETLIIGGPLRLPQTSVTIYARRLELAGADAHVCTTPVDGRTIPPGQVTAGLAGGDIILNIASCAVEPAGGWRFRVSGTPGHNGGMWGEPGEVMRSLDDTNPLAWLSPYAVKMVLAHARDAYLCGYTAEADELLSEYRELLEACMGLDTWGALDAQRQMELEQMYGEVVTLLHRLESGLDYFGNLPGWVPMLSFEVSKAFYEQEISRAVRVLYLSYWVQNKAATIADKAGALARSREAAWDETQDFADQYAQVQALIPKLKSDAERIAARIGRADGGGCSGLLCQLKQKEEELIARADRIVQKRHEVPWWKKALKGLGTIVTSTIEGASEGGQKGAIIGAVKGTLNVLVDELLTEQDPWPAITNRKGVEKEFYVIDFEAATGEWLEGFDAIPNTLSAIEQNGADTYLQGLRSQAASMAGGMHQIKETLKATSLSNEEVEAELKKIKAQDPIFNSLVDQVTQLAVEKEVFNRQLAAAMQKVSTLANGITNNLLAIDGMNRDASHQNRVLDPRATMYVKDMERRALERLQKYHYYLAKSYEYRLLRPSPMDLNIGRMFTAMQNIVSADGTLDQNAFNALKTVYEEQLWSLTDQIYRDYQDNKSYEATAPVRLELTAAQIAALNAGNEVAINLKDAARFQYNEENTRIVDIEVETLEFHVEGTYNWLDYFDLEIEHAGVCRLQKDGEIFGFVHYKDLAQETNPINWNERHFADGFWQPVDRSDASRSMLFSLLENCAHAGTGDIMLYARPGAWADIVIKKTPHEENSGDLVIDSIRLLVRYDRIIRPVQYSTLQVVTQPQNLVPYFEVSRKDRWGRQDGVGEFYRTYNTGTAASVTAPLQSGNYAFVKWTDGGGNAVSQNAGLLVNMDANRKRIAQYVYTGPMPSAADFNEDFMVDFEDFVQLAEAWHAQTGGPKWNAAYDISDPADGVIDGGDLLRLAEEWLAMP